MSGRRPWPRASRSRARLEISLLFDGLVVVVGGVADVASGVDVGFGAAVGGGDGAPEAGMSVLDMARQPHSVLTRAIPKSNARVVSIDMCPPHTSIG